MMDFWCMLKIWANLDKRTNVFQTWLAKSHVISLFSYWMRNILKVGFLRQIAMLFWFHYVTNEFPREKLSDSKSWIKFRQITIFVLISLCNQEIFTRKIVRFEKLDFLPSNRKVCFDCKLTGRTETHSHRMPDFRAITPEFSVLKSVNGKFRKLF